MSYSKAVQQRPAENMYNPTNNLAIVLDCPPGISVEDCCEGLADVISGKNMVYSSRLGGGRICVYLRNLESVKQIIDEGGILVKGCFIPVRKFLTEAIKIVLSNVSPIITNERIAIEMAKYGKIASTVRQISNGYKRPDIAHMLSFRRIMYMIIDKPELLPESIFFEQDSIKYQIYVSRDELTCFKCKGSGHLARNCKKNVQQTDTDTGLGANQRPRTMADAVANRLMPNIQTTTITTSENTHATVLKLPAIRPTTIINNNTAIESPIDDETAAVPLNINKESVDLTEEINEPVSQDDFITPGQDYHPTQNSEKIDTPSTNEITTDPILSSNPATVPFLSLPSKENKRKFSDTEETVRNLPKRPSDHEPAEEVEMTSDSESHCSDESFDSAASSASSRYNRSLDQEALKDKSNKSIDKLLPFIKERSHYPLKPKSFLEFLKRARGAKEPQHVALEFTKDLYGLLKMTEEITPKSKDYNLRRRMTRISNAIIGEIGPNQ